jgi:hypothetical protein
VVLDNLKGVSGRDVEIATAPLRRIARLKDKPPRIVVVPTIEKYFRNGGGAPHPSIGLAPQSVDKFEVVHSTE